MTTPAAILSGAAQRVLGPSGRHPLRPHVFLMGVDQRTLGPSGYHPMHPWCFRALPHASLVLPDTAPRLTRLVLVGADQRTLGPSGRCSMHPWSSRALTRAPLIIPGAALRQKMQSPLVRSGGCREKISLRPRRKGSSCEVWIEKGKQKRRITVSTLLNYFL